MTLAELLESTGEKPYTMSRKAHINVTIVYRAMKGQTESITVTTLMRLIEAYPDLKWCEYLGIRKSPPK